MQKFLGSGFIKGLLAGGGIAAAALIGYAHGQDGQDASSYAEGLQAEGIAPSCQVRVGFGRMTSGNQCSGNRVMVGQQGNYLLCADLTVTCTDR